MKKNISINISGIIFHIEEDGYGILKRYLDDINKYFSTYEDSEEIVADIEGRIAEIFLSKLKEDKQVITKDDVETLVQTMGQVSDFEAIEEEEDLDTEPKAQSTKERERKRKKQPKTDKRILERDTQRNLIGGVCAGMANYFNTDPLWTRGLFIFFFFIGGISLIAYPLFWIFLKGNDSIPDNDSVRKFYRDPDDRIIGGVSGGLGKYFNTNALIFRILFIIFFFSGFGIIMYIILWAITPKANSITDKMQMKGKKVTLSNIESSIKENKEEELNPKGENAFTKILLFPFRLIGNIFSGIGRALGPLMKFIVAIIRVFTGGIIALVGLSVMVSILIAAGTILGFYHSDILYDIDISPTVVDILKNTVPEIGILFLLAAIVIPFIYVFIAGITIITKKRVMTTSFGWSMLGVWIISILGATTILPSIARDFNEEGYIVESEKVEISADTLTITVSDKQHSSISRSRSRWGWYEEDDFIENFESDFVDLQLEASKDSSFRIENYFRARGRNERRAEENAEQVDYYYSIEGNTIIFDTELTYPDKAKFYDQSVSSTFYIPVGQPFKLERKVSRIMRYVPHRSSWWRVSRNVFMFDENKRMVCLTCEKEVNERSETKTFEVKNAKLIRVFDSFNVEVKYGEPKVEVQAPGRIIDELEIISENNSLRLSANSRRGERDFNNVNITVYTTNLKTFSTYNRSNVSIDSEGFDDLSIRTYDKSKVAIRGELKRLILYVTGNSKLDHEANVETLIAYAKKSGRIYGYDSENSEATIETSSDARVRINVSEYLKASASDFSSIRYKGAPTVDIDYEGSNANIKEY